MSKTKKCPQFATAALLAFSALMTLLFVISADSRAAVTVEDAYCFAGHKNLEHYGGNAASWASLVTSPTLPTGVGDSEFLSVGGATPSATVGFRGWPGSTPNTTTFTHIGGWLAINNPDIVVDTSMVFMWFGPNNGDVANYDIALGLTSTGGGTEHNIHIVNANGSNVTTTADVFEDDTWYWLDLYYIRHDTAGVAILYVSIAGSADPAFIAITGASEDFNDGSGSGGHAFQLDGQRDASVPFAGQSSFFWKVMIVEYGTAGISDGTFMASCLASNPYKTGTTSDTGDNLVAGDWDDVSDGSATTHGDMGPNDAGGIVCDDATSPGVIGPKDQFGTGVTVLGAKWAIFGRNAGTAGNGGVFYGKYTGAVYTTEQIVNTLCDTQCNVAYFEAAGGTYIPDVANDWFVIGIANENFVSGNVWARELRTFMFTSFPYDAALATGSPWHHRAQMGR